MNINKEKFSHSATWVKLIDELTHDLATPLSSARSGVGFVESCLPELLEAYDLAVQNHLLQPKQELKIQKLKDIVPNIKPLINKVVTITELSSLWNQKILSYDRKSYADIKACIDAAIEACHLKTVSCIEQSIEKNFTCYVDPFFIEHGIYSVINGVLLNLPLEQIKFMIATHEQTDYYILEMSANKELTDWQLSKTLDFFSAKNKESGVVIVPGAGYCRLALLELGGDITAEITSEKHTRFTFIFPK